MKLSTTQGGGTEEKPSVGNALGRRSMHSSSITGGLPGGQQSPGEGSREQALSAGCPASGAKEHFEAAHSSWRPKSLERFLLRLSPAIGTSGDSVG